MGSFVQDGSWKIKTEYKAVLLDEEGKQIIRLFPGHRDFSRRLPDPLRDIPVMSLYEAVAPKEGITHQALMIFGQQR